MRKWAVIIAVAVFTMGLAVELVRDIVTNDPIGYFRHQPSRLLYVAGIAILGGLLTLGFHQVAPRTQWRVRLFGLGAAAGTATAVVGYFGFSAFSLARVISEHGGSVWAVLLRLLPVLAILCIASGYFWFETWRVWKVEGSR